MLKTYKYTEKAEITSKSKSEKNKNMTTPRKMYK
jgi:hypothetical protein